MNLKAIGLIASSISGVYRILPGDEVKALIGKLESRVPVRSLIPKDGKYFTPEEALANAIKQEQERGLGGGRGPWR